MSAKSIVSYGFLFFILFILTSVHSIFVLIFFITIIIIIIYKVKQKRKSKINLNRTHSQSHVTKVNTKSQDQTNHASWNEQIDPSHITNQTNHARIISDTDQIKELNVADDISVVDLQKHKIQESFQRNDDEIIKKKTFDRSTWNFRANESILSKEHKFLKAINICKENNLGSKTKMRRLRIKLNKWDIEALTPDYEYLLDLIEEFENQ